MPLQRLKALDVLRGIALCGILVMNIVSFALPATAYSNPTVINNDLLSNHLLFSLTHIFFDQKMMGLFSLLFGASVILFVEKLESNGLSTWGHYYLRIFWLLIFGLLHGILLWQGDILFFYALCGLFLFLFRYLPKAITLLLGLLIFYGSIFVGEIGQHWLDQMSANQLEYFNWAWKSNEREIADEISRRLSPFSDLLRYRFETSEINPNYSLSFMSRVFIGQGILRAFGLMLIGMALYRYGIFSTKPPKNLALITFTIGTVLASYGLWQQYQHDWGIGYSMFRGRMFNHLATPFLVYSYALMIIDFIQEKTLSPSTRILTTGLENYGRMAFSNYIFQSAICTTLFYGYGFGMFGQFDRGQLLVFVFVIVTIQIIFSTLWLSFFRYGPLEWLWRCFTFFRLPPIIR